MDVHALDASGAAHEQAVFFAQHDGRTVPCFHQPARHNAQHPSVPSFPAHHCAAASGGLFGHLGQRLLSHVLVQIASGLVHRFQFVRQLVGRVVVAGHQQFNCLEGVAHSARSVDAWTEREADVTHGVGHAVDVGHVKHGADAWPHGFAQFAHAVVGKDAVFTGDVHQVGTDAQREQVQMVVHGRHGQANGVDERREELERHAGSGQFFERISRTLPAWG